MGKRSSDERLRRSLTVKRGYSRRRKSFLSRNLYTLIGLAVIIAAVCFAYYKLTPEPLSSGRRFIQEDERYVKDRRDADETAKPASSAPLVYDRSSMTETQKKLHDQLLVMYESYPALRPIAENMEEYPDELIMLVLHDPEAIDFLLGYKEHRFDYGSSVDISISGDLKAGEFPHFLQWDKRWGYLSYGDSNMAVNGCGATALSIVITGLTGNAKANPYEVAVFSEVNDHYSGEAGTSWTLISEGAKDYGLTPKEVPRDANALKNAIRKGPVIASMGPGSFTSMGHFLVLVEVTGDGLIRVIDPNSIVRSDKLWSIDVFLNEGKNYWSFTVNN